MIILSRLAPSAPCATHKPYLPHPRTDEIDTLLRKHQPRFPTIQAGECVFLVFSSSFFAPLLMCVSVCVCCVWVDVCVCVCSVY